MTRLPKFQCINHIYHWVHLLYWPTMQMYLLISSQQSAMHQLDLHQVVIFAMEVITESAGSSNTNVNTEWLRNPIFILACFRAALVATCKLTFHCVSISIFIFFFAQFVVFSTLCIASAPVRACALSIFLHSNVNCHMFCIIFAFAATQFALLVLLCVRVH